MCSICFRQSVLFNALLVVVSLSTASLAAAQETATALVVGGEIAKPRSWSAAELAALPHTGVSVTEKDGSAATYSGASLAAILQASEAPFGDQLHGPALSLAVAVRGADGYQAIFSLAELDPAMSGKQVLLADQVDGKPLNATIGPLRLIVPDEKRHARWVRQVVKVEVVAIPNGQPAAGAQKKDGKAN